MHAAHDSIRKHVLACADNTCMGSAAAPSTRQGKGAELLGARHHRPRPPRRPRFRSAWRTDRAVWLGWRSSGFFLPAVEARAATSSASARAREMSGGSIATACRGPRSALSARGGRTIPGDVDDDVELTYLLLWRHSCVATSARHNQARSSARAFLSAPPPGAQPRTPLCSRLADGGGSAALTLWLGCSCSNSSKAARNSSSIVRPYDQAEREATMLDPIAEHEDALPAQRHRVPPEGTPGQKLPRLRRYHA